MAAASSRCARGPAVRAQRPRTATRPTRALCRRLVCVTHRAAYHADVAEPAVELFEAMGYSVAALGGGRIVRKDAPSNTVEIYGFSVGFGGGEGGPPGRGMRDHSEVAALVTAALPTHTVTYSADGY